MLRILVVDDEPTYRATLQALLARAGFDVAVAGDGETAVAEAARRPPDVLIVDWMLRGTLDGLAVAAAVRAHNAAVATILITGFPSAELQRRLERLPATCFLAKPFELDELTATIRQITAVDLH